MKVFEIEMETKIHAFWYWLCIWVICLVPAVFVPSVVYTAIHSCHAAWIGSIGTLTRRVMSIIIRSSNHSSPFAPVSQSLSQFSSFF